MSTCCKLTATVGFFIVAFFFSMIVNHWLHVVFSPNVAEYLIDAASGVQIVLILYATGFMECIHRKK